MLTFIDVFRARAERRCPTIGCLAILLAACRASQPLATGDVRPAASANPVPSLSSAPTSAANDAAEPPRAHPHAAEHHHEHDGYHMDFSEVERFARHFDSPDRDAWQKPSEV